MPLMKSWVASANDPGCDFPLNNLPYGVFSNDPQDARCGVAIGDQVLDLAAVEAAGLIRLADDPVFDLPYWNDVMDLGPDAWAALRALLTDFLREAAPEQAQLAPFLVPLSEVRLHLPIVVSEFTDFYAGRHHATNVGTMFRGAENALPANWLHIPIGYNGRASTVVVSGTEIRRPWGQIKVPDADVPAFKPTQKLDIELELGAIVGVSTSMGQPISVAEADQMIFGYLLLNDWSARDIQAWEYQPLGPFQAKAFATSVSPWIVTTEALAPFRASTPARGKELLPHLQEPGPMLFDIDLAVLIEPEGGAQEVIAQTNYNQMYYSAAQQLAHHASSGCAMNAGDLLGSGTISGPEKNQRGSLLELSWGGEEPIALQDGGTRCFVEDGDTLTLTGHAQGDGYRIGFGACAGKVLPALDWT
ncbi:fumarylacetoacetase [uncultured Roseobacter sp.]|uniref:fumarylacetoacetase n=1 Tax=uncultured Roseobacter sp. TaxID=114847 RepID=UPI002627BFE0|nr:fumarylacetoacetase [uncultured Roseobacter sp.]